MTDTNRAPAAVTPGLSPPGSGDRRWRIWASRHRTQLELYVTSPDGSIHPVAVQLSVLLHPSVRTRGVRDDAWWGAAARTAAEAVAATVRSGARLPTTVTVRRFGPPAPRLALAEGTMELVLVIDG